MTNRWISRSWIESRLNKLSVQATLLDCSRRQLSVSALRLAEDHKQHESVGKKLQHLEDSLRYHGYSTIRIGLFIMFAAGMGLYIFRESIRENVADEVSQVAYRSLEDQMVVVKAEQFAKGLLDAVMNDEQMSRLAAEFVVGVLQRDETKQATATVLRSVIDDPITRNHLILATKQVFLAALYDEETQQALKVVFKHILADDETRQAAKDLLAFVFAEDDIKNLVADFFKDVIRMEIVVNQATELGKDVTHNVISDPVIQKETGDSMWRAFTYSMTPRWFSTSTPPNPISEEVTSSPPKSTSPETGETETKPVPSLEDKEHGTESKKDVKDAIKEQQDAERMLSQQHREEQEEMADLTLVIEEP
ncbi:uncharacterized protein [Amphiura filiformis]|uniref:uncharacterized protein n=1 Tax=Amphiura filiformis TaxID=82378 RepID=UPI003B21E3D6